jgi:hypothetical protein
MRRDLHGHAVRAVQSAQQLQSLRLPQDAFQNIVRRVSRHHEVHPRRLDRHRSVGLVRESPAAVPYAEPCPSCTLTRQEVHDYQRTIAVGRLDPAAAAALIVRLDADPVPQSFPKRLGSCWCAQVIRPSSLGPIPASDVLMCVCHASSTLIDIVSACIRDAFSAARSAGDLRRSGSTAWLPYACTSAEPPPDGKRRIEPCSVLGMRNAHFGWNTTATSVSGEACPNRSATVGEVMDC